jgi:hypothetical protein
MKPFVIALLFFAGINSVLASKEGILPFSRFHLESDGIGSSGKILIDGQQNQSSQIAELRITAFGRNYVVPKEQLAGLAELPTNGVRISYEAGYKELGGRTLYIQLQMGFTSFTKKQALITVTENGKVEVSKIELKET